LTGHSVDSMLPTMQAIVAHPSLSTEAAALIRQEILAGRMKSGERLVETRLAADMGIRRAPVREALKLLRTDADVRELYDVRAALEARAARVLARAHRGEDVAALGGLVEHLDSISLSRTAIRARRYSPTWFVCNWRCVSAEPRGVEWRRSEGRAESGDPSQPSREAVLTGRCRLHAARSVSTTRWRFPLERRLS